MCDPDIKTIVDLIRQNERKKCIEYLRLLASNTNESHEVQLGYIRAAEALENESKTN